MSKARFIYSHSVTEAITKWPVLKTTLNQAKKSGIVLVTHSAKLSNRGQVCQHWWLVKYEDGSKESMTNQSLLGKMRIYLDSKKRQEERKVFEDYSDQQMSEMRETVINPKVDRIKSFDGTKDMDIPEYCPFTLKELDLEISRRKSDKEYESRHANKKANQQTD